MSQRVREPQTVNRPAGQDKRSATSARNLLEILLVSCNQPSQLDILIEGFVALASAEASGLSQHTVSDVEMKSSYFSGASEVPRSTHKNGAAPCHGPNGELT